MYFETSLFRKPNFRPHYLSCFSDHPVAHKSGIFFCETYRILVCCARSSVFDKCIFDVAGYLRNTGYPSIATPNFDQARRESILQAALLRSSTRVAKTAATNIVTLVLPFQKDLQQLGINSIWSKLVGANLPIRLRVAWSVRPNSLRKLYGLNWPADCSVQGTGIG
jgi:hypothetical protein